MEGIPREQHQCIAAKAPQPRRLLIKREVVGSGQLIGLTNNIASMPSSEA